MDTFANMDTTPGRNAPYIRSPRIFTAPGLRFNEALDFTSAELAQIGTDTAPNLI
ncbi:transposase IS3/IS911 family protein [Erwinia tracheiphila PSU-1]|nr:transposase IS3/IS911 family protein [Erwinia tracheiphila PSU-1]